METKNYINEVWKPIMGYVGLYEVSNFGRVRSVDRWTKHTYGMQLKKGKILKLHKTGDYLQVALHKNNVSKTYYIHRLVADAFIPNPDNLPCVGHKDENPENNCADNLYWTTYEANNNYGTHNLKMSRSKSKPVEQYTLEGKLIARFRSQTEAADALDAIQESISDCCLGKRKTYKDCIWKFAD